MGCVRTVAHSQAQGHTAMHTTTRHVMLLTGFPPLIFPSQLEAAYPQVPAAQTPTGKRSSTSFKRQGTNFHAEMRDPNNPRLASYSSR
eukprot:2822343-Prymnesium_polylepis.1